MAQVQKRPNPSFLVSNRVDHGQVELPPPSRGHNSECDRVRKYLAWPAVAVLLGECFYVAAESF